jgi:hypothetical protein
MAHGGEKRTKAFDLAVREKLSSVGVSMHDRYNSSISVLTRENI